MVTSGQRLHGLVEGGPAAHAEQRVQVLLHGGAPLVLGAVGKRSGDARQQLAQQLLVYGRPLSLEEIVERIESVDRGGLGRVLERMRGSQPSLAVIGPTAGLESFESLRERLSDSPG